MKKNKSGFILAETIAVSVIVLGTLIFIYGQFISINNSYYTSFKYNAVDDLYRLGNVVSFVEKDGLENLMHTLSSQQQEYIDFTNCQNYFIEQGYCEELLKRSGVRQIIFTTEDTSALQDSLQDVSSFSEEMKTFIHKINSKENNKYRLIVEFDSGNFATLKIS